MATKKPSSETGWTVPPGFEDFLNPPPAPSATAAPEEIPTDDPPEDSPEDSPEEITVLAEDPAPIPDEVASSTQAAPLNFTPPSIPPAPVDEPKSELRELVTLLKDAFLTQATAQAQTAQAMSMEEGVRQLVSTLLDARYAQQIFEQAVHAQGSVAAVVAGILSLQGDRGTLGEFAINPEWIHTIQSTPQLASSLPPTVGGDANNVPGHCQGCNLPFRGRLGQRYCCTPCGKRASGYANEPLAHSTECKTAPAILQQRLQEAAKHSATALQAASV